MNETRDEMARTNSNHSVGESQPSLSDRVRSLKLPERTKETRKTSWFAWVLCVLLAGATGYMALEAYVLKPEATAESEGAQAQKETATVSDRVRTAGKVALEVKGYIIPFREIQVSPKVGGMVTKLNIEEGMSVEEGDILAELEVTEYKADYDKAVAAMHASEYRVFELKNYRDKEIEQVRAELEDTKAQREQLYSEYQRKLDLRNNRATSVQEYEEARSAYKSMDFRVQRLELALELIKKGPRDEQISAAKAEYRRAKAEVEKAKWRLDNCRIIAPASGIILTKRAEEGNIVNPSAFSNGLSASLCDMADLSNLEVDLAIPERDISKVRLGQKCAVRAEAYRDRLYEGEVARIMPIADRAKGAVPVRVKIFIPESEQPPNKYYLRPEMGAIVTFYR